MRFVKGLANSKMTYVLNMIHICKTLRTLAVENKLLALAFGALNVLDFELGFKMGVVSIDAFQVYLELLPNFHNENPAAFHLYFRGGNPTVFRLRCS